MIDQYFLVLTTIDLFVLTFMCILTKLSETLNSKQKRGFFLAFVLIGVISILEVITILVDGAPVHLRWLNILSNYLGFGLSPAVSLCLVSKSRASGAGSKRRSRARRRISFRWR